LIGGEQQKRIPVKPEQHEKICRSFQLQSYNRKEGNIQMKRYIYISLTLALLLSLSLSTAVIADSILIQQFIEKELVPLAQSNDDVDKVNERFSNIELRNIMEAAQENSIDMPDTLLNTVNQNRSEYEEEVIMSFARKTFGGQFVEWTIEQKHWFGEMMIAIGFREQNNDCIPKDGEISFEQALSIAVERINQEYGDNVRDNEHWKMTTDYLRISENSEQESLPQWYFNFTPNYTENNGYQVILNTTGEIVQFSALVAPTPESSAADVIKQFEAVYGHETQWSYTVWAALGEQIKGRDSGSFKGWMFKHAGYGIPQDNAISEQTAIEIALKNVGAEYTTVSSMIYCLAKTTPIWKIETHTMTPTDEANGTYTAIWLLEIDALTGDVQEKRKFEVGTGGITIMTRMVPFEICDDESIVSAFEG